MSRGDGPDGVLGNSFSMVAAIDAAGTQVAFETLATSFDGHLQTRPSVTRLYVRDLRTLDTSLVAEEAKRPHFSADGAVLTFRKRYGEIWKLVARDGDGVIRVLAAGGDPLPHTSIRRAGRRVISGTAIRAARVHVAVVRQRRRGNVLETRWLDRSGRWRPAYGPTCPAWIWTRARGTRRWSARLPRRLPRGSYVVYSRAQGAHGERENGFDEGHRNRVSLRVR